MRDRIWLVVATFVLGMVAVIAGLIFTVQYFANNAAARACDRTATETGRETKYVGGSMWSNACYIKVKEGWVPLDKWRVAE